MNPFVIIEMWRRMEMMPIWVEEYKEFLTECGETHQSPVCFLEEGSK
jgi:hypothetical protein